VRGLEALQKGYGQPISKEVVEIYRLTRDVALPRFF
jgi:hypothetical protein